MSAKTEFHITIGVALEGSDDITTHVEHHLRLAKAALLYADRVTLCSPTALLMTSFSAISGFTERQQVELLEMIIPSLAMDDQSKESGLEFCRMYHQLRSSKRPSVKEIQMLGQIKKLLEPNINELREKAFDVSKLYKADQFAKLLETKRLEIKPLGNQLSPIQWVAASIQKAAEWNSIRQGKHFNVPTLPGNFPNDTTKIMEDYINQLENAIKNPSSYPLFDDFTGNLVRVGLKEGRIEVSEVHKDRAKPVGLAADLMERLPTFDAASVDEIIDIRKELDKPLVKFRAAMIKFSKDTKSAAWDEDFPIEAEEVFRAEVQPTVAEMEDAVRSNKWLYELAFMLPVSVSGGGMLGAGISALAHIPDIATTSLGVALGLGVSALEARRKWAEKQKVTEDNQLFFYYKAGQLLENKRR